MLIAVVGGKLQGVEALYLARKAGYKTLLVDKNPEAIAKVLCDQFLEFQFTSDQPIPPYYSQIDLILPAIEDDEVLSALEIWSKSAGIPFAFDQFSYKTSRSKLLSNELFTKLRLPTPQTWPNCSFPVVVKPDQDSGSRGVAFCSNIDSLQYHIAKSFPETRSVIQEYLQGPAYSIEIIGVPGKYVPLQVTDLHMDKDYDCKRVTAPTELPPSQICFFENMALTIAAETALRGIMDVEVILHDNKLKLLEIDARLPSQTPMAVYWSTGMNMVEMLCELFLENKTATYCMEQRRHVSIEHIRVEGGGLEVCGEHIMSSDTLLTLKKNFFGSNEALTSYQPGKQSWVATMIFADNSRNRLTAKRKSSYETISRHAL